MSKVGKWESGKLLGTKLLREARDRTYNRRGAFFAPTGNEDEYAKVNAGALQPMAPISEIDATEDDLRALGIGSALRGE